MNEQMIKDELEEDYYEGEDEDSQKDLYLTFRLGNEDYGIEIQHVTEIVGLQKITSVPDMPEFVKGVINLRGNVIPVIDVRLRFHMDAREYDDRTCVVVVRIEESQVGFIVDTVNEVANIPQKSIEPPPKISRDERGRFILGLGKVGQDVKILLNVNKLLHEHELEQIGQ